MVGHELWKAQLRVGVGGGTGVDEVQSILHIRDGETEVATKDEVENFANRLEESLDVAGFANEKNKASLYRNIRAMFNRMELTGREVKTLHGIVSALSGQKKRRE